MISIVMKLQVIVFVCDGESQTIDLLDYVTGIGNGIT